MGFFFLPFLWLVNVWLFWPDLRSGRDREIQKYARRSLYGVIVSSSIFFPWFIFFFAGGKKYLGDTYRKLDITTFPLSDYIAF